MAVITISRGSMSGGMALAECLAKDLGYPSSAREALVKKEDPISRFPVLPSSKGSLTAGHPRTWS